MRRDLTDALIRTLHAPEGGRLEIWDGRCEGLVLRVSEKGRVTFHARARGADGRKRFAGLGTWPSLSLAQARTDAHVTIGLMQKGGDPTADRRTARADRAREAEMPTLRELGQAWAKAHARDTSARYRTELLATIGRGCGDAQRARGTGIVPGPDLMARPIDRVTIDDIAGVVQAARARGDGEARHLVRGLRRLFGFALAARHVSESVVDDWLRREKGGRRSIPWMRDGIRERVLSDAELAKLWTASAALDLTDRAFTRLLLLTACRSGEITGLAWHELVWAVDDRGVERFTAVVLPAGRTKNRRAHRVPLAPAAAAELQAIVRSVDAGLLATGFVFSGIASRTAGLCRALRQRAGVHDWTWHDLRRTAATTMARLGCPREHVEAALNHISTRGGLVGIYQRYTFDQEAAQALLRWQAHLAALVETPSNADQPTPRAKRMGLAGLVSAGRHPLVRVRPPNVTRRDPDPPASSAATTDDSGRASARRICQPITPAISPGQGSDESSDPPAAVSAPSAIDRNDKLPAMIRQISNPTWNLIEAALSPVERQLLQQVRRAVATRTRREADDDAVLLRIELYRRVNVGVSTAKAVRDVVASLRTDDPPNRSGGQTVTLGDQRFVSESAAVKHLMQKFQKHKAEIVRRANGQDVGTNIAQRYGHRVAGPWGAAEMVALATDLVSTMDPAALKNASRLLDGLSLPDAADAVRRKLFKR